MKAFISENHVPISKFKFEIAIVTGDLQFLTLSMPEEEMDLRVGLSTPTASRTKN